MSGGFQVNDGCISADIGTDLTGNFGTALARSGSANTYGAWAQLTPASPIDCTTIQIVINLLVGNTDAAYAAFNIGIGGAGSEIVIFPNLAFFPNDGQYSAAWTFPISIPAGTRISAQVQYNAVTGLDPQAVCSGQLFDEGFSASGQFAGVDSYGFIPASTTIGTTVVPGLANTKGAYATLISSAPKDYQGLEFDFTIMSPYDYGMLWDIAVGAAGAEQIILSNLFARYFSYTYDGGFSRRVVYPFQIPAGTRVSARCQSNTGTSAQVVTHGVF